VDSEGLTTSATQHLTLSLSAPTISFPSSIPYNRCGRGVDSDGHELDGAQPSNISPLPSPSALICPPSLTRSRTPDPTSDNLAIPADHAPLSRCTTAPSVESFSDVLAANAHDPAMRHMTSANKLTRMGFSAKRGWQPSPASIIVSLLDGRSRGSGSSRLFKGKT
jgi:hypothetical protein